MFSAWAMDTRVCPATDKGIGCSVMQTGDKPRIVTQLACYSLTNTTGTAMNFSIVPATSITPLGEEYSVGTDNVTFPLGFMNADIAPGTEEIVPLQFLPFGAKGATSSFIIIPPNCILICFPTAGNLNGTWAVKSISAEMG